MKQVFYALLLVLFGIIYLVVQVVNNPSPKMPEPSKEAAELATIIRVQNECAHQFAAQGKQAVDACFKAVMERRDREKLDSVYSRTR